MDNNMMITVVSVHSPLIQFSSSGSYYTSYAISLKSNDPCFTHAYSQVRRRYSEFVHLRRLLESHYPTFKPPVLPPKNYFQRFSDALIEERKAGLQTFLEQVLSTSVYLSDKSLHLFLQTSFNMNQIDEECIGDIPAPQLMDSNSEASIYSSIYSDTSSSKSLCDNAILTTEDTNLTRQHNEDKGSDDSDASDCERHIIIPKISIQSVTPISNSNSLPFTIPRRQGSLDSSPASSLSSLDTSYCSSLDFNRRKVSFNQNVTVAVVYNHLWNIGTRPIRTDA